LLLNLFGCATPELLKAAKENASEDNIRRRRIVDVSPVAILEKKNIRICVKTTSFSPKKETQLFSLKLPLSFDNKNLSRKMKFRKCDVAKNHYPGYDAPRGKVIQNCSENLGKVSGADSIIYIEVLTLTAEFWDQHPDLIREQINNKLNTIPVLIVMEEVKSSGNEIWTESRLIYMPPNKNEMDAKAIWLDGLYQDDSTKVVYAFLPFALILDAIIIASIVVVAALASLPSGGIKFK
jgi:hypothetical protein